MCRTREERDNAIDFTFAAHHLMLEYSTALECLRS
jgi:hypothetical protein